VAVIPDPARPSAANMAAGLSVVKIGVLLERRGVVVPYRTVHRFCVERCGSGCTAATVRVAAGEPAMEWSVQLRLPMVIAPSAGADPDHHGGLLNHPSAHVTPTLRARS
jgi:hypothetical protein